MVVVDDATVVEVVGEVVGVGDDDAVVVVVVVIDGDDATDDKDNGEFRGGKPLLL